MSSEDTRLLSQLRQPEYTGQNRCLPCTVVNVVIAAVVGGLVAIGSPVAGVLVFALSLFAIYVRGYLIPGTPTLTKRYMPDRLHQFFGHHPASNSDDEELPVFQRIEREREHAVEPDQFLLDTGAIEECEDGEAYCLTDSFRATLENHRREVRKADTYRDSLGEVFGKDASEVEHRDREYPAFQIGIHVRKWPSEAALVSDVSMHRALAEVADDWLAVPSTQRREILESLRGFNDACPICGGRITLSESVVDSCCGRHEVKTLACEECDRRLQEFDQARVGAESEIKGITP
ncbi:MAG: hypothetical protein V5A21_08080 [Halapricum sp.]